MAKMSGSVNETSISSDNPHATGPKSRSTSPQPFRLQVIRRIPSFYESQRPAMPANSLPHEIQLYDSFNQIYPRRLSANVKAKLSDLLPARPLFFLTRVHPSILTLTDPIGVSGVTCEHLYIFLDRKVLCLGGVVFVSACTSDRLFADPSLHA